jgi:transcriptional regulator with XRE-family HTH domain
MSYPDECAAFSARLQQALALQGFVRGSPTVLAREFNLRYDGKAVTVHAARKWLLGESIPTQEKLRTIANWLGVSAEWLRYGDNASQSHDEPVMPVRIDCLLSSRELSLVDNLKRLSIEDKKIVRELIHTMARLSVQGQF